MASVLPAGHTSAYLPLFLIQARRGTLFVDRNELREIADEVARDAVREAEFWKHEARRLQDSLRIERRTRLSEFLRGGDRG